MRRNILKPGIPVLALGVDDLEKATEFNQKGRGLETEGIFGNIRSTQCGSESSFLINRKHSIQPAEPSAHSRLPATADP